MGESSLSSRYLYSELLCDSFNTEAYSSTISGSSWGRFYFTQTSIKPAGIKVVSATIPHVFDTINAEDNVFYISSLADSNYRPVTITPGTYNGPNLAIELETAINLVDGPGYTVTWYSDTSKFTFTGPDYFAFEMRASSPRLMMGFNLGITAANVSDILVSTNPASPSGPFYLFLNSTLIGPTVRCDNQDNSETVNQICRIPINVQKHGLIDYRDPNPTQFFDFSGVKTANSFDLYLTLGDQMKPLDMKGMGFSVVLGILGHREGGVPITQRPGPINFFRG